MAVAVATGPRDQGVLLSVVWPLVAIFARRASSPCSANTPSTRDNKGRVVDRRPPRRRHPATHRCQAGQPERPPHPSISALAELIDMLMLRTGVVAETSGTAASTDHG